MRGKRLARLLVLFAGAILGVLVFTTWASAREFVSRAPRTVVPRPNTTNNIGGGLTGPSTLGGGSTPSALAGHAGDITPSLSNAPAVIDPPSSRSLSPRVHTTPSFFTPLDTIIQGTNSGVGGVAVSGAATATNILPAIQAGPVGGSQVGNNTVISNQNTTAITGDAIVNSQVFGNSASSIFDSDWPLHSDWPFDDDPFFHHHSSPLHHFGSWSPSLFISGDNVMSTSPWGTTFVSGDNVFVAGGWSPWWGWGGFHSTSLIAAEVRLDILETLVEMADDCLARLATNPSFARARICEHLLEQVAERTWSSPFLAGFSPFGLWHPTAFISQGGTHALFSSDGFSAVSSSSGNTIALGFGPWGWGPFGFGVGGFSHHSFPVGTSGGHVAVLAPWTWSPVWHTGGSLWHPWSLDIWELREELAELRAQIAWERERLEHLAWHHSLVLGTIHSHSLDWSPWFGWTAPFGHRTVFVSGDNVFVGGSPVHDAFWSPFWWDHDDWWDHDFWWHSAWWDLDDCWWWGHCFWPTTHSVFWARHFGPVLDMPGITVG